MPPQLSTTNIQSNAQPYSILTSNININLNPVTSNNNIFASNFSKLPNPISELLKGNPQFSVDNPDKVLHFLRMLRDLTSQSRALGMDNVSLLQVLYPFTHGLLTQLVCRAIDQRLTLKQFHSAILQDCIPLRLRGVLEHEYFYRPQGSKETFF